MSKKTDALMDRLKIVLESEADKDAAIERASMEAMMRTQARQLRTLDKKALAELFAEFEQAATARDRKLIAAHPLRPDATAAIIAAGSTPTTQTTVHPAAGASTSDDQTKA
ncbi:hypothetical protein SAMN04488020_12025 [Palleronia marisminoris]|uniref:Uncharacterized protein n=1 Tax=Palleronia marisminoris TaxID=315423 RepID=A0A1Y5TW50_9RHOB|nr:hypothetical protein [Palleronia marisminoris]SFH52892.1 hypothetical protein SAMN04488020_12025 [Palleronia marisminoris]SLN71683.1 hypothetical protein PAM7066_03685 [Palleronia marisminoris]